MSELRVEVITEWTCFFVSRSSSPTRRVPWCRSDRVSRSCTLWYCTSTSPCFDRCMSAESVWGGNWVVSHREYLWWASRVCFPWCKDVHRTRWRIARLADDTVERSVRSSIDWVHRRIRWNSLGRLEMQLGRSKESISRRILRNGDQTSRINPMVWCDG